MGEIIEVGGNILYTHQWINNTSDLFTRREAMLSDIVGLGLATRFHKACLRVFKLFLQHLPVLSTFRMDADQTASAKEELGRLYLWGESFGDGCLDKALEQSDEIRDNVFELFRGIGGTLLRGKFRFPSTYCLRGITTLSDGINILYFFT